MLALQLFPLLLGRLRYSGEALQGLLQEKVLFNYAVVTMVSCGNFYSVLKGQDVLVNTKPAMRKLLMAMAPCETGKGSICVRGYIVRVLIATQQISPLRSAWNSRHRINSKTGIISLNYWRWAHSRW